MSDKQFSSLSSRHPLQGYTLLNKRAAHSRRSASTGDARGPIIRDSVSAPGLRSATSNLAPRTPPALVIGRTAYRVACAEREEVSWLKTAPLLSPRGARYVCTRRHTPAHRLCIFLNHYGGLSTRSIASGCANLVFIAGLYASGPYTWNLTTSVKQRYPLKNNLLDEGWPSRYERITRV